MQVRIEDVSPVEKKLVVEIPWEVVSAKLGAAYRDLGREVALKGFRKGKAPRAVLEQVYGPRVNAEVAVQLVRESFFQATSEHKLEAVAEPRVEEGGRIQKGQPFAFAAIVALRRGASPATDSTLTVADLELDLMRRRVVRGGRRIQLTAKEFSLLELLIRHKEEVLPRSMIASQVWDMNFDSHTNVVDVHVRRLRAKVDDPFEHKLIHTVRGIGYTLEDRRG